MEQIILSAKDLQKMGFSRSMAYRLLNRSDMPVLSIGERKFMNKELFMKWLEKHGAALEEQAAGNVQQ